MKRYLVLLRANNKDIEGSFEMKAASVRECAHSDMLWEYIKHGVAEYIDSLVIIDLEAGDYVIWSDL